MKKNEIDTDALIQLMDNNKWIKYLVYAGGTIIGIWILGKASTLLSNAIVNFKSLHNAIKH
jgi:hypothetical protein